MKSRILVLVLIVLSQSAVAHSQSAQDAVSLTGLLNIFLAGASHNDAAIHDRFWADDLIYTRSSGIRTNKADLMKNLKNAPFAVELDQIDFVLNPTTQKPSTPLRTFKYINMATPRSLRFVWLRRQRREPRPRFRII